MLRIKTKDGEAEAMILGVQGAALLGHVDGVGRMIGSWEAVDDAEFWKIWTELGGSVPQTPHFDANASLASI